MRTHDGYDAWDSYNQVEDAMGENVCNGNCQKKKDRRAITIIQLNQ